MLVYSLFVLWPLVQTSWLALQEWNGYGPQHFVGLDNIGTLARDAVFRTAFRNSVFWVLAAALILTSLGMAVALFMRAAGLRRVTLVLFFLPVLLPPVAVAAIWTLVYSPLSGGLNNFLGGVGLSGLEHVWLGDVHLAGPALFVGWAWSSLGIGVALFSTALNSVGREYIDIARVEGAGALRQFRHVLWPALRRPFILVALMNAALAMQVFDLIFVTTGGGPGYATMTLTVDMYGRAFGGRTGQGAASGLLQVALGILLALAALVWGRGAGESFRGEEGYGRRVDLHTQLASGAAVVVFAIALLAPFYWLGISALGARSSVIGLRPPSANPIDWKWSAVTSAWNAGMGSAFGQSLVLGLVVAAIAIVVSVPGGFAMSKLISSHALKAATLFLLVLGLFQPTVILIVPLFALLRALHLLDSFAGVALPEIARLVPFGVLVVWLFVSQLSGEIVDAARSDGAGSSQLLFRVALPSMRPAVALVGAWGFITSWNEYLLPTVVSQNGALQTVPTVLATFIGRSDTQYDLLAGACLVAVIPALTALLVLALWASTRR